jgi:hypothetical protein
VERDLLDYQLTIAAELERRRHEHRIDVIRDEPLRYLSSLIVRGLVEVPVQVRRRRLASAPEVN